MIIEEWKNSDLEKDQILKIMKKVYPNSEFSTSKYFDWQYRNGPYGIAKILLAKDDDNSIIGIEPILPMKLYIDSKIITSSLSCNSVVDPDFRNKGIFYNLISNILKLIDKKEISSIYSIPNIKSHNIFIKNGFKDISQLPLLVRPLKISNYFPYPMKGLVKLFEVFWKVKNENSDIELFTGEINSDFEKIITNLSKRVSVVQKRDKEFLQWRYKDHPSKEYDIYVLKENTQLKGYIITSIANVKGKKIGVILDFVFDSTIENKEGPKNLVKKILKIFWEKNAPFAIATCGNSTQENQILKQVGFIDSPKFLKPEPLYFVVGGSSDVQNLKKMKEFKNWFFTFGDYDIF